MARRYLHCCLAGFGIVSVLYLVEAGLGYAGLHGLGRLLDETLLGIVAGLGLFLFLRRLEASRELRRRRRHEEWISHLNHHIRNALQLIVNRAELGVHSAPALSDIQNSVNRIDWALREFLPSGNATAGSSFAATPAAAQSLMEGPRPPCLGIYPRYVPGIELVSPEEPGTKLANGTRQVKTSVLRDKSA
jgi:hypothetical protein